MSFGDLTPNAATSKILAELTDDGIIILAAAGNNGPCDDCLFFPARDSSVLAVGCIDDRSEACSSSAIGAELDLVAPGRAVRAAGISSDTAHVVTSGTSMAAPYAAGILAAWTATQPELTFASLSSTLEQRTIDLGAPGWDNAYGFGKLAL